MSTDKFGRYRAVVAARRPFFTSPLNNLNMGRKRIQQLGDPELEYDAANKKYVTEIKNKLSKDISSLEKKLIAQLDRKIIEAGQHADSLYAQTIQMVEGALNISITKNEMNQKIDEIESRFKKLDTKIDNILSDLKSRLPQTTP